MTIPKRALKWLAAGTWYVGAGVLLYKGSGYLLGAAGAGPDIPPLLAATAGVALGVHRGRTHFLRACHRNIARIEALERPRVWQIFRPAFFLALALMVSLAALFSWLAGTGYWGAVAVGGLELVIAVALLVSSTGFWRRPVGKAATVSMRREPGSVGGSSTAILVLALACQGCISYTAGTTARPVPAGELRTHSTATFLPNGTRAWVTAEEGDATAGYAFPSLGWRLGLDPASELQIEMPGISGVVVGYKRRILGSADARTAAVAASGSAGVVNLGNHAYVQATLIASGPEFNRTLVPYGGLRAMHVIPLEGSISDAPVIGGFLGLRVGRRLAISPEIGVFYDEPVLGLRDHALLIVPAIPLHGLDLMRLFGGLP